MTSPCRPAPRCLPFLALAVALALACTGTGTAGSPANGSGPAGASGPTGPTGPTGPLPAGAVVLASLGRFPTAMALAGDALYVTAGGVTPFATDDPIVLVRIPLAGGAAQVVDTSPKGPGSVAWDGAGHVYWASCCELRQVDVSGGSPVALVSAVQVNALAAAPDAVYWEVYGLGLFKKSSADGRQTLLAPTPRLTELLPGAAGTSIALGLDQVFYTLEDYGWIMRVPASGGDAVPFVVGQAASGLVSDGHLLFWVTAPFAGPDYLGAVRARAFDPAVRNFTVGEFASAVPSPALLAVDDTWVYWANVRGDTVYRAAKTGLGGPQVVASGLPGPRGLAMDAQRIYVALYDGRVVAVPR